MRYHGGREFCSWPRVAIVGLTAILACIALVGEVSGKRIANERAAQAQKKAAVEKSVENGCGRSAAGIVEDATQPQRQALVGNDFPEIEGYGHVYAIA